ncbi:putative RNA-directed DNA polymerase [Helianthus anomalus]
MSNMTNLNAPKLMKVENYLTWKDIFKSFIKSQDARMWICIEDGYIAATRRVDGRVKVIPYEMMDESEKLMVNAEKKALAVIKMSLPEGIKHTIKHCGTSYELWEALEKRYQSSSRQSVGGRALDEKANAVKEECSNECSVHLEDNKDATQAFMAEVVPVDEAETTVSDAESEVKDAKSPVENAEKKNAEVSKGLKDVNGLTSEVKANPKESHMKAVKRIFRYLKGKPKLGLWYPADSDLNFVAYTDSDFGGCKSNRKSSTGGCQFLGGRIVSWQCKKQSCVSTSTCEAEYIAAGSCCSQVLWIQQQMRDYGLDFTRTPIMIDNNATISITINPVKHSRTKHIDIRHHFIRDCAEKRLIELHRVDTEDNLADLYTKAFDRARFEHLVELNGMRNPE